MEKDQLASDPQLVKKMVQAALSTILDLRSFSQALTGDVKKYNLSNEYKTSTAFDDVFVERNSTNGMENAAAGEDNNKEISTQKKGSPQDVQ